ncbi:interleukin-17 receptor D-like [Haliotis cracherodii]|uniref:interleukin-17 receptor D-like n=1 Tax=Haliotis cracherodii TaxID=6455 RepID=UPI0039E8DE84
MTGLHHPFKECKLHTKTPTSCNPISHLAKNNAKSGTVIFVDIPENRYMLEVQASDPFWREHNYALCFSVQESGKHRRKECLRTRMKNIVIGEGPDESQSATESNILLSTSEDGERPGEARTSTKRNIPPGTSDNKTKTLLIAAGVCLCLVSTVILIIIFTRKHVQVKDEWVRMRRVYLLAYDDHAAHTDAVKALATLLKKHCNCDVIYPKWFIPDIRKIGLYEWITTQLDKSDFVVLVNSKVAYSRYTARNWDTHFRVEDSGPEADAFSFSTSHLRSKEGKPDFLYTTIMAYFNYTNTTDLIPFNPGLHYKLPENLLDLVNHIHDCNKSSLGESDILGTTEGKALVKAVDEAKAYQQRVPEWFSTRVFMHESDQGLVLNSASKCTQVVVDPEDLIPTLKDVSAKACTDRSSETQDVSIDSAEAVTLVLETVRSSNVETEFPTNDEFATNVCPASGLGKSQESKQFSPEHFYPPVSYSESLCTVELEDRLFAITSDSYINNVWVSI